MKPGLPPLNALRAFEAAARLGHLGLAGEELHVTHGAISRQIRLLEDHLGVAVFVREGRGLRLTPAGRELQTAAAAAFARVRDAVTAVQRGSGHAPLVLGCPGSLLARWVIPRMERLSRELPDLTVHLAARESGFDAALSGLDAALLLAEPPWPDDWHALVLANERIGPVLSPRMAGHETLASPDATALLQHPLLHTSSRPQAWPAWASAQGLDPGRLRMGTGFEHLYYLLEAAIAGVGIAIAPEPLVAEDVAAGRLIAPWGFRDTGGVWLLATRQGREDARFTRLAQWLRDELAGQR